jgi:isopenicillin-N N-acyltransferase-like protein
MSQHAMEGEAVPASFRKISISGDGRTRGRQHGEELRGLVQAHQARWAESMRADLNMPVDAYLSRLFGETRFLPAIERHTPDLLEEVRGIAEGAGTDFAVTLAIQLSDEEPWFRRRIKLETTAGRGCTAIGVDVGSDAPTLIAQNMDMPKWSDGHQVLVDITDDVSGTRALVFTLAGKLSLNGLNAHGVGICCNGLSQLDHSPDGLPEDFVVRGFLTRKSLEDGLDFMRSIRHASGQNYVVGGPGARAVNIEVSAERVVEWRPDADARMLFHTNHPLANDDQAIYRQQAAGLDEAMRRRLFYGTSHLRMAVLNARFTAPYDRIDIDGIKAALSDHDGPVCRHGEIEGMTDHYTIGCMVMELGGAPRLHVAPGPPCQTPFETHGFD